MINEFIAFTIFFQRREVKKDVNILFIKPEKCVFFLILMVRSQSHQSTVTRLKNVKCKFRFA